MSEMPSLYSCTFCGAAIKPLENGTWRQVTGWVEQRTGGGAHAIGWPSAPHAYACRMCMNDKKLGGAKDQTSLF